MSKRRLATRITTRTSARIIRKLPIFITALWKWETLPAVATNFAVRPKNVFAPVAVITATISPCLTTEPEYASSPDVLTTGSDFPVSAEGLMVGNVDYIVHKSIVACMLSDDRLQQQHEGGLDIVAW